MSHSYQSFLSELEFVKKYTLTVACSRSSQEVYTPNSLAQDMLSKIPEVFWTSPTNHVMDPCVKSGIFLMQSIENFMRGLESWQPCVEKRFKHIIGNQIYGFCRSSWAHKMVNKSIFGDMSHTGHIYNYQFLDSDGKISIVVKELINKENMKFDAIVGNPPYQTQTDGNSRPIWHLFVENSIKLLEAGGYLCYVHPSGWRNVEGAFENVGNLIKSKDVEYLEIHDEKDGMNTFGAMTRYDWYVLKNSPSSKKTTIKFQDGSTKIIDLNTLPFIPNGSYDKIVSLLSVTGDGRISILYNCDYHHQKEYVSKEKTGKFKYPVFYCINQGDKSTIFYSSEKKGHFGISKFIWSNGYIPSFGCVVDPKGEYGMTQFCYAIVDEAKNLDNIKKAFDSKAFRDLMFDCKMSENSLNRKVLALFRKDFYKEFI